MSRIVTQTVGRLALVVALTAVHRRHRPLGQARQWRSQAVVALSATAAPAAIVLAAARRGVRWTGPASAVGTALLAGHVALNAAAEELLWRGPLIAPRPPARRAVVAAVSATGFLAAHLHRDGRSAAPVHLVTTLSWTGSALIGRSLWWPGFAHAGYNLAALTLAAATPTPPTPKPPTPNPPTPTASTAPATDLAERR